MKKQNLEENKKLLKRYIKTILTEVLNYDDAFKFDSEEDKLKLQTAIFKLNNVSNLLKTLLQNCNDPKLIDLVKNTIIDINEFTQKNK